MSKLPIFEHFISVQDGWSGCRTGKQQPGTAGPGNILCCCFVSFHYLRSILSSLSVGNLKPKLIQVQAKAQAKMFQLDRAPGLRPRPGGLRKSANTSRTSASSASPSWTRLKEMTEFTTRGTPSRRFRAASTATRTYREVQLNFTQEI